VTAVIDIPIALPENEDRIGHARSMRRIDLDGTSSTLSRFFSESGVKYLCFNSLAQIGGVQTLILTDQHKEAQRVKFDITTFEKENTDDKQNHRRPERAGRPHQSGK
jgi:hypothetical protein